MPEKSSGKAPTAQKSRAQGFPNPSGLGFTPMAPWNELDGRSGEHRGAWQITAPPGYTGWKRGSAWYSAAMKIARVTATPLNVPLHIKLMGIDRKSSLASCYVEVETDTGLIGH